MISIAFIPKDDYLNTLEIQINGQPWRTVHPAIFGRKPKMSPIASIEDLQAQFDVYEHQRVKGYIIWRLSKQSYHTSQLAKLLKERLVQLKTIEKVLEELSEKGLCDDDLWMERFFTMHKGRYSLRQIIQKLLAKGIDKEEICNYSEKWSNPEEEYERLQVLIAKIARKKDLSDFKMRQKVIVSLIRKGFSIEHIKQIIVNY